MQDLTLGGLSRFSSVDWPGRLCAVFFVQGCPWRCGYCHNPGLQPRQQAALDWHEVLAWLPARRGLLDGVVFSGGEPLLDAALPEAMRHIRSLGFAIGLHTAGIYPERLRTVLPLLDWVGLDIKAALDEAGSYERITGSRTAWQDARDSLDLVLAAQRAQALSYECRTTWHPDWLDTPELQRLAGQLHERDVRHWVLQEARHTPCWRPQDSRRVADQRLALRSLLPTALPQVSFRPTA
ncbi:anaerobic ribonucleoside-triphosphate reductase activating protein [Mitsuaria sp. WAJ17]|uniref:anaerobic ribonucleoside-triphosphate reductase activating protein n=1 Tax=Mitsuaria sp. WAJ17 TaxID=2761452 RepID=UPI0015FFCB90|nr:anaerobic ribonucleoside-triphosphate reductase activating protein [Mitsuaria sp. WAJ17]MBB2484188.1 anaerobic ribonucleoside-triphosphate reductase activating protein [Mitsuaria sp. WAJ17]